MRLAGPFHLKSGSEALMTVSTCCAVAILYTSAARHSSPHWILVLTQGNFWCFPSVTSHLLEPISVQGAASSLEGSYAMLGS